MGIYVGFSERNYLFLCPTMRTFLPARKSWSMWLFQIGIVRSIVSNINDCNDDDDDDIDSDDDSDHKYLVVTLS